MRVPLPTNRLVALALVGALLTSVVAVGLALPDLGGNATDDSTASVSGGSTAADAPTPNENFTPAVSTQARSGGEYEEHEEEEHEEEEHEEEEYEDEHGAEEHEG